MTAEEEAAEYLKDLIVAGDELFAKMSDDRHAMGEKKYGPVNFLVVDSIEMALEEIVDLGNYARYTFIKLYVLQQQVAAMVNPNSAGPPTLGPSSFTPSGG